MKKRIIAALLAIVMVVGMCALPASAEDVTYENWDERVVIHDLNSNGLELGYAPETGVEILRDAYTGYYFKDLNKNGILDPYEDWRLTIDERTEDLLSQMSLTEKFALMTHGSSAVESGYRMNVIRSSNKGTQADGSSGNALQIRAEATAYGIPYAYSADPMHTGKIETGTPNPWPNPDDPDPETEIPATNLSKWPNTLGMANSFSADLHYTFGQVVSQEYRNSQIFQQLGPLIDQATHPTWGRISTAITEDYDLLVDLVQAEVAGMQTTEETIEDYGLPTGWGKDSISAMTKHLLGTGSGEFGYEGHTAVGGWLVYPGGGHEKAIETIADASGFGLFEEHSSQIANAGMTAYAIAVDNDGIGIGTGLTGTKAYTQVGGGYSNFIMNEYLRDYREWDGMITSDWGIYGTGSSNHGMQDRHGADTALRYLVSFMSGMSQTGGAASVANIQLAYDLGVQGDEARGIPAYGEEAMNEMVDARAGNVIKTLMKVGLFENPYSDPYKADAENGSNELNTIALQAHHESIVMLKNHDNLLPLDDSSAKVYAVGSYDGSGGNGGYGDTSHDNRGITETAGRYYDIVDEPDEADYGIVMITSKAMGNGAEGLAQTAQFAEYTKEV